MMVAGFGLFDGSPGTDHDPPPAGFVGGTDAGIAVDDSAGRKIGGFDVLHQLLQANFGIVDHGHRTVDDLAEVVGQHIGSHPDGNSGGAVDEQGRYFGGEYGGFLEGIVEVVGKIDRILFDVRQDFVGDLPEASLGVAHGGGAIAIHGAKVALAIDQGVAQRPGLGHPHHGVVYRLVAVGVIFTQDLPHAPGGFFVGLVVHQPQFAHAVEHATVDGFEPIPDVG